MKKFSTKIIVVALMGSFALAGCQTENAYTGEKQTSNATRGAVIGAIGGALLGALTHTRGKGAGKNALIGAGVGAIAGVAVGSYMDKQEAELRDKLRAAGVSVTRDGNNIILNMQNDILFDTGSAVLSQDAQQIVRQVANVLKEFKQTYVNVNGFTDTTGSNELNDRLSQSRAEAVADRLSFFGVQAQRISPQGFGEHDLKIQTGDNVNEPRNRRVEIVLEPISS